MRITVTDGRTELFSERECEPICWDFRTEQPEGEQLSERENRSIWINQKLTLHIAQHTFASTAELDC